MEIEENTSVKWSFQETIRCIPLRISQVVERFFYQLGLRIARQPGKWLIGCSVIVLLCLVGLLRFRQEKNPLKLWVPPNSDFINDTEWLMAHFGEGLRVQTIILTADDILEPQVLAKLNDVTKRVIAVQTSLEPKVSWTDICLKVPVISEYVQREERDLDAFDDDFFDEEPEARMNRTNMDPVVEAPTKLYCNVLNNLPKACLLLSILDIWDYDSELIGNQTKMDIVMKFNSAKISPTLGHRMNFTELLGGVTMDEKGRIVSATAVKTQWMVRINFSEVDMDRTGNDVGTADWATEDVLAWESAFLRELETSSREFERQATTGQKLRLWYEAGRSFGDISSATMFQDIDKLIFGIILMSLYVQLILCDFNWVGWKFYLTSAGLLCVGGAFIIAVGVCSLIGVPYGPVHTSLPFMLMGLGIDDIFIMQASWEQVITHKSNCDKSLPEKVALMLSHAGAAICITSLTDVVAFVIGASTILPSLQSFCIYAAVGVFVTFLLQITFYVSFFTLDMRRMEAKRNGIFPCIVHENYEAMVVDTKHRIFWRLINYTYSNAVLTVPGKLVILLVTVATASIGILGSYQLEQRFNPNWFLPKESYLSKYLQVHDEQYPKLGHPAAVFIGDIDYPSNFPAILNLTETLTNMTVLRIVESWPKDFVRFVANNYDKDVQLTILEREDFEHYLSKFLFSKNGGKYQKNFRFDGKLTCGDKLPRILVASIDFSFVTFSGPDQWIPAMDNVKRVTARSNIDGFVTVWSKIFATWVTDKVIAQEVTRNLILALVCVMGTTVVLIAELQTCFWILICVLLTLLDVCGFMYYWGLTVDIVSCIGLELAVGLSVDYAAHVAHAFLHVETHNVKHDRTMRAQTAVRHIGAAVFYGAGSTLLALSLLARSQAYVFRAFFKIFLLVIVFGLWHGLFLLPVVLSTIGPRSLSKRKGRLSNEINFEVATDTIAPLNIDTDR